MIWLTWRQHGREAMIGFLFVSFLVLTMTLTHGLMSSAIREAVMSCPPGSSGVFCGASAQAALGIFNVSVMVKFLLMALPVLVAVFVAAPMIAREIEQGTHNFVWVQSVTRLHWFAVKASLVVLSSVAVASVLSLLADWWHQPFDAMVGSGSWSFFEVFGLVPVAYVVFGVALALALSVTIRRTVPAMAATLVLFAIVRVAFANVRPWLMPPVVRPTDLISNVFPAGSLQMDLYWTDATNHRIPTTDVYQALQQNFPGSIGSTGPSGATSIQGSADILQWLHDHGYHLFAVYQPADRIWTFQVIEAAIFLGMTVLLIAFSAWWLQQRVH